MSEPDDAGVLRARGLRVDGSPLPLLEPTDLVVAQGHRVLVAGDPGHGHTALALALAGRLRTDGGTVGIDGRTGDDRLRRAVALVDVPGVSEPDGVLPLATLVGEELALAGRRAGRPAVADWLAAEGLADLARTPLEALPGGVRTTVLSRLAAARAGVRVLVLTVPDRFGTPPPVWWHLAGELALAGFAVVVTCTTTSAHVLAAAGLLGPDADVVPLGGASLDVLAG